MSIRSFQVRPGLETGIFHIVLGNLKWHPHWKSIRDVLENDGVPIKVDYVMVDPTGRLNAWVRLYGLDNFERAVSKCILFPLPSKEIDVSADVLKYTAIEGRIPTVFDKNRTDVVTILCFDDTPQFAQDQYWYPNQPNSNTLSPPPSPPPSTFALSSYGMSSSQTLQPSTGYVSHYMHLTHSPPPPLYPPYSMSPPQSFQPSINHLRVSEIPSPSVVSSSGTSARRLDRPSTPVVVNGSG